MFDCNKSCRINKPVKFLNHHNKDELQCNKTALREGRRFEGEKSFLQGHRRGHCESCSCARRGRNTQGYGTLLELAETWEWLTALLLCFWPRYQTWCLCHSPLSTYTTTGVLQLQIKHLLTVNFYSPGELLALKPSWVKGRMKHKACMPCENKSLCGPVESENS